MRPTQRVRKAQLWLIGKTALIAAGLAGACDVIMFLVVRPQDINWSRQNHVDLLLFACIAIAITFGTPAFVAIRHHRRFRNWYHGFIFGCTFGVALFLVPLLIDDFDSILWTAKNNLRHLILNYALPLAGVGAINGITFVVLWTASRESRGRLLVTDGTRCPNCGYELRGNTSGTCSECGRAFQLAELEIDSAGLTPNGGTSPP